MATWRQVATLLSQQAASSITTIVPRDGSWPRVIRESPCSPLSPPNVNPKAQLRNWSNSMRQMTWATHHSCLLTWPASWAHQKMLLSESNAQRLSAPQALSTLMPPEREREQPEVPHHWRSPPYDEHSPVSQVCSCWLGQTWSSFNARPGGVCLGTDPCLCKQDTVTT